MRRTGPRLSAALAAVTLALCGGAAAQPAGDAKVQSAYAEWRKLPQAEVNCVDRAIQKQRSNLWTWIERGVAPTDSSVAKIREACGGHVAASNTQGLSALAQSEAAKKAAAEKAATEKASAEKTAAAKIAAEKAAFEKAATEKLAAEKAAAEKLAAEKAAAEKIAAEKLAAEKAAADKLAAEKRAAEKAAADKAVAEKAAAEKAAAEAAEKATAAKRAAEQAAAEKEAAEKAAAELAAQKAAEEQAAAEKAAAEKAAIDAALADAERVKAEAIQAKADAETQKQDAINAAFAHAASEARINFVYGLILGAVFATLLVAVLLMLLRKKSKGREFPAHSPISLGRPSEFDRLATAMQGDRDPRFGKPPAGAERQSDWSQLH